MDFEPRPEEVRAARHFVARTARGWGVESGDLVTVVGELAANAVRHARTPFSVSVSYVDQTVVLEVADGSRSTPVMPSGDETHRLTSGRGLLMVDALALAWGARCNAEGKVVWAEIPAVRSVGDRPASPTAAGPSTHTEGRGSP